MGENTRNSYYENKNTHNSYYENNHGNCSELSKNVN